MDEEFGSARARMLAEDHALTGLGSRTAAAALDDGVPPRQVWAVMCEEMRVPVERRLGQDRPLRRD